MSSQSIHSRFQRRCTTATVILLLAAVAPTSIMLAQATETSELAQEQQESSEQRIADLQSALNGTTLVGNFTITGETDAESPTLTSEQYELSSVRYLGDGNWLFESRIRYGDHDVPVRLVLPVRWAGDTPVITVDNLSVPALGTYTARVMIYGGHYAGFWTGADHGGHLFGVVRRSGAAADRTADEPNGD